MLIMAACTNRFAATVYSHTTVGVMLYGIMMENYGIAGWIGVVAALPTLLVVTVGIRAAQRMGQKKALVLKCLRLKVTVLILSCINTTINSNWKKMPSPVNNTSAFFCPIRCAAGTL